MLTRFQVSGFKNLLDLDVRFGPFNCIIGANGVGKSNLFDAIHFLSLLADRPLMDAAAAVRDSGGRKTRDILGLFYRSGTYVAASLDFTIEVLVPREAEDDFGQKAEATNTLLRYSISIGRRNVEGRGGGEQLILRSENLMHVPAGEVKTSILFPHQRHWRDSVVQSKIRSNPFISTEDEMIQVHQDGGGRGKPQSYPSENLKRTVVSATNTAESPTVLAFRRELQSWFQLQLEPSALRRADESLSKNTLSASGEHMPATLSRLAGGPESENYYAALSNKLAELDGSVRRVRLERDEARDLIAIQVTFDDGTTHPASALSDGTLRFLALAILESDPGARGLLCLEEPENGMHPDKTAALIRLLRGIAVDPNLPVADDNPLRQVIVNTHSPAFASQVPGDSLLSVEPALVERDEVQLPTVRLAAMADTWRTKESARSIKKGTVLQYLDPIPDNGPKATVARMVRGSKLP